MGGGWGGNCPPKIKKTRKFSVEVGNFEGGIETAIKKRVPLEMERVSILNEQTKWSRSICIIFLSFYALTFISKTRRKWLGIGWVQYRYLVWYPGYLERDWERRSSSQCRSWSIQNFPWGAHYKTNDPRIVKFSMSMFGAGNNWIARSVLRQSRGSLRKICQRSSYQYSSNIQVGQWQIRVPRSLLSQSKLCLLKLKEFLGSATQQKNCYRIVKIQIQYR